MFSKWNWFIHSWSEHSHQPSRINLCWVSTWYSPTSITHVWVCEVDKHMHKQNMQTSHLHNSLFCIMQSGFCDSANVFRITEICMALHFLLDVDFKSSFNTRSQVVMAAPQKCEISTALWKYPMYCRCCGLDSVTITPSCNYYSWSTFSTVMTLMPHFYYNIIAVKH